MSLIGKRALVTGGGTGSGAAMARRLARDGAQVVVCGRRPAPLAELVKSAPGLVAQICDVTDEAAVVALFDAHGPFDIVVANAGVAESAPLARTTAEAFDRLMAVNVRGAFLTCREAARQMSERYKADGETWGRIVTVASTAGLKGYAYAAAYAASKHAVVGLTRSLALEMASTGVTVNALCPGFMDTGMTQESITRIAGKTGRSADQARDALAATNPMGRLVPPEDVAEALLWLCGPGSGMITGQALAIAGGEV